MASSIQHHGIAGFRQERRSLLDVTNATFVGAAPAVLQTGGNSVRASRLTRAEVLETPVFCRMLLS